MVGVLITLLFAVGAMGVGQFLVRRWTKDSDPAEAVGIYGLIGLGVLGLVTLPIGLMPGGLKWGLFVVCILAAAGYMPVFKSFAEGAYKVAKPDGANLLCVLAIGVAGFFALVGVLAPSDTLDWDTLAYHLAVPKMWLEAGQIHYIPFLHQSNFPSTVENLFVWGLTWGEQSGAKAFTLAFFIFGVFAVFGVARRRYGSAAGWCAALGFVSIPVVMWESGTGYIDVPQGLYGGLGVVFLARFLEDPKLRSDLYLGGIFLGFAAATKYTGLQTIALACFVVLLVLALKGRAVEGLKSAVLVGAFGIAVSGAWYAKSVVYTGNPVFPFFFERLGGKNWDQRRADAYREEQQQFGAGTVATRHNPAEIGAAVLGLAYQPGRYVNPDESHGNGTPLGAIGVVAILAGLVWALSGKLRLFESSVLGVVGLSMLAWFFLSEQSRYVVPLCVSLAILAGGAISRLKVGRVLLGVLVAQTAYSLYLVYSQRFTMQSQVAFGKISRDDYEIQTIPFADAALGINKMTGVGKVALYDEVFGYLLDVPYFWANPPHSMVIPYDSMTTGPEYALGMKKLGFTHIYISTSAIVKDRAFVKRWRAAMGLDGPVAPFAQSERDAMMANWKDKWMVLLTDAVVQGLIRPVQGFKHGILFQIQ